ncbi:hypothetical protein GALL_457760 [mine drainage metagenome]|uniref:Uncharacterized protein n=1 Tax=mine drainage metagenome TaxID=410659 RepID=A0A1J5PXQ9_9ZZZZ
MDADHVVDDELQPRQTHALVRQLGEAEGEIGVADIHHDLGGNGRHLLQTGGGDLIVQRALVDVARVALGTRHRDRLAVRQGLGGAAAADDGGNAEFAGDDRGGDQSAARDGDDSVERTMSHQPPRQCSGIAVQLVPGDSVVVIGHGHFSAKIGCRCKGVSTICDILAPIGFRLVTFWSTPSLMCKWTSPPRCPRPGKPALSGF